MLNPYSRLRGARLALSAALLPAVVCARPALAQEPPAAEPPAATPAEAAPAKEAPKPGPAGASAVTPSVKLPAGAIRLPGEKEGAEALAQLNGILDKLKLAPAASEVLLWKGGGYKEADGPEKIKEFAASLKTGGYAYEPQGSQKTDGGVVTIFVASRPENAEKNEKKEAALGIWVAGSDFLMLIWAQAKPKAAADKPEAKPEEKPAAEPAPETPTNNPTKQEETP